MAVGTGDGVAEAVGVGDGLGVVTVTVTDPVEPPLLDKVICAEPEPTDIAVNVAGAAAAVVGFTVTTFTLLLTAVYGGVPPFTMNDPESPFAKVSVAGFTVIAVSDFFRATGVGDGVGCGVTVGAGVMAARLGSAAGGGRGPGSAECPGCSTAAGALPITAHSMTTENPAAPTRLTMFTSPQKERTLNNLRKTLRLWLPYYLRSANPRKYGCV